MPRPRKCRRIGFIPNITKFVPHGNFKNNNSIINLTLEELEAIRLIDLVNLDQIKASEEMNVSRGTIQRILNSARSKIADSLINGNKIIVEGGNYEISNCKYICGNCGNIFIDNDGKCPSCGSEKYNCLSKKDFCKRNCNRFRGKNNNE